jgi:integrase/recombinase XerC/integrase/recombinase XerD
MSALKKSIQHHITKKVPEFFATLEQFLATQDVTKGSKITYRNALRQFFSWFIEAQQVNPTRETILKYKEDLDLKGLRPSTRASYLVAVRKFFEWAEGLKIYPNIAKGIKGARRALKHHQKDALSIAQIKKTLSTIDRSKIQGKRDFALINLLLRTGLRLIEVVRADYKDLDLHGDDALLWVRGKGRDGKDECVVLAEDALRPLLDYLRARKSAIGEAPLFTSLSDRNFGKRLTTFSLSRIIKRYLRLAGINNRRVTAHSLRHTFGVLSIKAGASLYEVQLAMRHTNPGTTEIYLGDIERQKRLEGAPEKKISALLTQEGIK